MRKNKNGFTLVELLIVISIISILTVITVTQFQTAKKKANDVARKGDLNAVSKALQMYFTDYGVFPPASGATGGSIGLNQSSFWGGVFEDQTVNPSYVYMKKLPVENVSANPPYCYKVSVDLKKFALFAQMENLVDKECDRNNNNLADDSTYTCGGRNYCYAVTSPNTSLSSEGNLQ